MSDSLVLSDGTRFEGRRFGAAASQPVGEVVLYTGVVGWQEVLTNPAYAGKIVAFTYPHVGNYGVNDDDVESSRVTVRGVVVRDLARFCSNFRATGDFRSWVERNGLAGLTGVDTRAVMVHTREHGASTGAIAAEPDTGLAAIREQGSPFDRNLVAEVQGICRVTEPPGHQDTKDDVGREGHPHNSSLITHDSSLSLAVLDLGGKYSLYRQLIDLGCTLRYFPWDATAEQIVSSGAAGVLLPPGPGDPNRLGSVIEQVRDVLGRVPVLGIGLGFQVLSLALGGRVTRLKAGRHGVNYPARSTHGEASMIVACHQSFALDPASVPREVEVTYVDLNDGTPLGIESRGLAATGYQFHPGRDLEDRPSPLLSRFITALAPGELGPDYTPGSGAFPTPPLHEDPAPKGGK